MYRMGIQTFVVSSSALNSLVTTLGLQLKYYQCNNLSQESTRQSSLNKFLIQSLQFKLSAQLQTRSLWGRVRVLSHE